MKSYEVLLHAKTYEKAKEYLEKLRGGKPVGKYLQASLDGMDLSHLTVDELIEVLLRTKQPQIFAESAIVGDGSD